MGDHFEPYREWDGNDADDDLLNDEDPYASAADIPVDEELFEAKKCYLRALAEVNGDEPKDDGETAKQFIERMEELKLRDPGEFLMMVETYQLVKEIGLEGYREHVNQAIDDIFSLMGIDDENMSVADDEDEDDDYLP